MKITINNAEESTIKTVRQSGNGGYIYIPSKWVGREVQIILLKEDDKMDKKLSEKQKEELIRTFTNITEEETDWDYMNEIYNTHDDFEDFVEYLRDTQIEDW